MLLQSVRTQILKFSHVFSAWAVHRAITKRPSGIGGSLLCIGMVEGGNRTFQVFILKVYHAFGWLLVPKLIMQVEEAWKHNRQNTESK